MSRIVRFHEAGGPEVLKIEEVEVPAPQKGEVRIAVKALGLNRAEAMFRAGQYLEQPKFPARIGYEASGTVEAIGDGVQDLQIGDAVSTIPGFSLNDYGVYGEVALAPTSAAAKHPASLSWEEAAAIWMHYATAYGALVDIAKLKKGSRLTSARDADIRPVGDPNEQVAAPAARFRHSLAGEANDFTALDPFWNR